jgi:hypothetical protein
MISLEVGTNRRKSKRASSRSKRPRVGGADGGGAAADGGGGPSHSSNHHRARKRSRGGGGSAGVSQTALRAATESARRVALGGPRGIITSGRESRSVMVGPEEGFATGDAREEYMQHFSKRRRERENAGAAEAGTGPQGGGVPTTQGMELVAVPRGGGAALEGGGLFARGCGPGGGGGIGSAHRETPAVLCSSGGSASGDSSGGGVDRSYSRTAELGTGAVPFLRRHRYQKQEETGGHKGSQGAEHVCPMLLHEGAARARVSSSPAHSLFRPRPSSGSGGGGGGGGGTGRSSSSSSRYTAEGESARLQGGRSWGLRTVGAHDDDGLGSSSDHDDTDDDDDDHDHEEEGMVSGVVDEWSGVRQRPSGHGRRCGRAVIDESRGEQERHRARFPLAALAAPALATAAGVQRRSGGGGRDDDECVSDRNDVDGAVGGGGAVDGNTSSGSSQISSTSSSSSSSSSSSDADDVGSSGHRSAINCRGPSSSSWQQQPPPQQQQQHHRRQQAGSSRHAPMVRKGSSGRRSQHRRRVQQVGMLVECEPFRCVRAACVLFRVHYVGW